MTEQQALLADLAQWQAAGWIRPLDRQLAKFLTAEGAPAAVALLGCLVSHQVGRGHTCLSIAALLENAEAELGLPPPDPAGQAVALSAAPLMPSELLTKFGVHAKIIEQLPEHAAILVAAPATTDELQPLVWEPHSQLLYLRRYWQHETRIQRWLSERMAASGDDVEEADKLREIIQALVPVKEEDAHQTSWQRVACANAAVHSFSVITGGPGTGKTFTVLRVLATLLALEQKKSLRIALAAPTGKAAARMQESITKSLEDLPQEEADKVQQALVGKASTLHRLLGAQPNSRYFRHHAQAQLPHDVVVVDEASMIDTEMFDALLAAIGPKTRLILLGDKDQLAPVEAGSVLASIGRGAAAGGYSQAHWKRLKALSGETIDSSFVAATPAPAAQSAANPLLDHVVMLRKSHRFEGAIADLAWAVNDCDAAKAEQVLAAADPQLVRVLPARAERSAEALEPSTLLAELAQGFAPFVAAIKTPQDASSTELVDAWAVQVLKQFSQYQLLCALRSGPWGQQQLNQALTTALGGTPDKWYHGRPVMVTANDYSLNLNNGDVGVVLRHPLDGLLKVAFPGPQQDTVRWVLPSRLVAVDTVYAMTVHKSQGSEFDHAVLILPDHRSPVLTKELIYTGITRAKKRLTLVLPDRAVWRYAITQRIERRGGLQHVAKLIPQSVLQS